ncbi:methyl-accepting chemotaxis protein [Caballeronia sp. INML1]|uniref:methyl-accepting chemotaxis protein n=1 Tax=Caballeronia sp. INML1 TaxID=2921760 RepID=UPI0020278F68|nr:methyl-accepting chemotaxis protein [Caballeronia sp. INML1]
MAKTLTIRSIIAIVLLVLAVLIVIVGAAGIYGIHSTNDALSNASGNVPTLEAILQQQELLARASLNAQTAAALGEPSSGSSLMSMQSFISQSNRAWETYSGFPAEEDERRIAARVANARDTLIKSGFDPFAAALHSSDKNRAQNIAFAVIPKLYSELSSATAELSRFQAQDSLRLVSEGESHERTTMAFAIALTVISMVCAISAWSILKRAISNPLSAIVAHFTAIEAGDLTVKIVASRDDELGHLMLSLGKMQKNLRQTVTKIRESAERVVHAAAEIAAGNNDLSKRTEQQAGALEETASSLEELTMTVKQNAESTREATELADLVAGSADLGAEAVKQLTGTMSELKDGSGKIAEIIAIIEGIAFQTNILALNAAVEAARAGEQGRGFAVVATEVRSLAQRSGAAAKEIKALISASLLLVDEGAAQGVSAMERVDRMLAGIARVAALLDQVSAASRDQARGIEQVTTAVFHMDEMTQMNAGLVEEASSASDSMKDEAVRMRQG